MAWVTPSGFVLEQYTVCLVLLGTIKSLFAEGNVFIVSFGRLWYIRERRPEDFSLILHSFYFSCFFKIKEFLQPFTFFKFCNIFPMLLIFNALLMSPPASESWVPSSRTIQRNLCFSLFLFLRHKNLQHKGEEKIRKQETL